MTYRTALVTGASSGLGYGLALALARRGTHVVAAARRKSNLEALVDEIRRAGGSAEVLRLDVSEADATHEAVRALDTRRPLDLVIANAGLGSKCSARRIDWQKVKDSIEVNLLGAAATICGALPGMVARGAGHIVAVSSLASYHALPAAAAYCGSKGGLNLFLESLRIDLQGSGVDVTTLCPGFVKTDMVRNNDKLPFVLERDDAVAQMLRAIDERKDVFAFPFPVAAAMRALPLVPDPLFRLLARQRKGGAPRRAE
jgi:short-subunit dehydrogenase